MDSVLLQADGQLRLPDGSSSADGLPCLRRVLFLQSGCTLRSFFRLLERYPLFQTLVPGLDSAVREAQTLPLTGCSGPLVEKLCIVKCVEITGYPGAPRVDVYLQLEGRGEDPPELRFLRLRDLLDVSLELGNARHVLLGETSALVCEASFTLFELIECVGWELGFEGGSITCNLER